MGPPHFGQPRQRPRHREQPQREQMDRQRRAGAKQARPAAAKKYPQPTAPKYHPPDVSETLVHFHKSFGVMTDIFEHRDFTTLGMDLLRCALEASPFGIPEPRFLDLGCAPGGFSACLLQDSILGPNSVGFGVSLPTHLGGFPMAFASDRFVVQTEDILGLQPVDLLAANNSIDFCVADAQYLKTMSKEKCEKVDYRGVHVKSRHLGIWALTVKECQLAFAKLRQNGSFVFRFGWRGVGAADVHPSGEQVHPSLLAKYLQEEEWYSSLTHWLFSVLKSLFKTLRPFKSEYVHQADVSFYMVCRSFDREKYENTNWEVKLQRAFDELARCEDEAALVAGIKDGISDEIKTEINELLEVVGRMRAIGIQSQKVTQPEKFKSSSAQASARKPDVCDGDVASSDAESSNVTSTTCHSGAGTHSLPSDASATGEEGCVSSSSSTTPPSDLLPQAGTPELRRQEGVDEDDTVAIRKDEICDMSRESGEGSEWRVARADADQKPVGLVQDSQEELDAPERVRGSGDPSPGCLQSKGASSTEVPWVVPPIESFAETAHMDAVDMEQAYSRHMHVSRFQSQLKEWQHVEDARRSREQEQTAADHVKRALHVRTFYTQLMQQQQQHYEVGEAQIPHAESQLQCFDHHAATDMVDADCSGGSWATELTATPASTDAYTWLAQCGMECAAPVPATRHAVADGSALGPHAAMQSSMPWQPPSDSAWLAYSLSPCAATELSAHAIDDGTRAVSCSRPAMSTPARTATVLPTSPKIVKHSGKAMATEHPFEPPTERALSAGDGIEVAEIDSYASSEDDSRDKHRKPYRHKKRAGRAVRERRSTRQTKSGSFSFQSLIYGTEGAENVYSSKRMKILLADCLEEFKQAKLYLHAMRFGLFCAMAWSMNSIIFSASGLSPR